MIVVRKYHGTVYYHYHFFIKWYFTIFLITSFGVYPACFMAFSQPEIDPRRWMLFSPAVSSRSCRIVSEDDGRHEKGRCWWITREEHYLKDAEVRDLLPVPIAVVHGVSASRYCAKLSLIVIVLRSCKSNFYTSPEAILDVMEQLLVISLSVRSLFKLFCSNVSFLDKIFLAHLKSTRKIIRILI